MRLAALSLTRNLQTKLGSNTIKNAANRSIANYGVSNNSSTSINSEKRKYTTYSQLPSEHQMVYEMCRKFADEELAPNAGKWDAKHEFPKDAVDKLVSYMNALLFVVSSVYALLVVNGWLDDRAIVAIDS